MSHTAMFVGGFCAALALVWVIASFAGDYAKRACMDVSGAESCKLEWVPQ